MKWAEEEHSVVRDLTELGYTVREFADETGYSVGSIQRSRAISKRLIENNQRLIEPQQPESEALNLLQLRVDKLETLLSQIAPTVLAQIRAKEKQAQDKESSGFSFKKLT